jgi:ACT domain-containing protein
MLVNADIYVKDVPGQLLSALEPMSMVNANVIGVVHSRERMIRDRISVNLTFDIDPDKIDKLKKIWKEKDVIVVSINSAVDLRNVVFMIIGNITAVTVEELMSIASEKVNIQSKQIKISSNSQGHNTCMASVSVCTEEEVDMLERFFSESCKERGYTYIRGI